MTVALIILIAVLTTGAIGVFARARRSRDTDALGGQGSPVGLARDPVPMSDTRNLAPDDLVLVALPNHRGQALVMGSDEALSVLDSSGLLARPSGDAPGQLQQLVRSTMGVGGADATVRAQRGIDSGRIVALSDETMRHLSTGKPVYDKAKNMLGVVKGDKGKIKHVMRLDKKGAQALVASNAATLAMTAAVGQQLAAIGEKLAEISDTLEKMVREKDAERLAGVIASNRALMNIAEAVGRRGMTQTDATKLASLDLPIISHQLEAEFKFEDLFRGDIGKLSRGQRIERLKELAGKERLDYWLAVRVQAELAQTRLDVLNLQWEITEHPETAQQITEQVRESIDERQERLSKIGEALQELTDPKSRTTFDPLHQIKRRWLGKQSKRMCDLLADHGEVFLPARQHPYAVIDATATDIGALDENSEPSPD
jgi:hypothetical protein